MLMRELGEQEGKLYSYLHKPKIYVRDMEAYYNYTIALKFHPKQYDILIEPDMLDNYLIPERIKRRAKHEKETV